MDFDSFVLAAATSDLGDEPAARPHADAIEFRMDGTDEPLAALESYDGELPVIATNRPEWEGGNAPDGQARLDELARACQFPAVAAIDVEFATVQAGEAETVVLAAHQHDVEVIVSSHDFEGTPDRDELRERIDQAGRHASVAKLAVTAESPDDVLSLLSVTREATLDGNRVATMAMGEVGRHSRAVAPLYGSRIGYAPVDPDRATAPGQYDLATLRRLIDQLQGAGPVANGPED